MSDNPAVDQAFKNAAAGKLADAHLSEWLEFVNPVQFTTADGNPDEPAIRGQVAKLRSLARNAAHGGVTQAERQAAKRFAVVQGGKARPAVLAGDQGRAQALKRFGTPGGDDAA
jgi:hypothetical protein